MSSPTVLAAPGGALVTSNKRDVVDATRDPRHEAGTVWISDPQQLANEPAAWWWNPLSDVTDEVQAERLAAQFAASSRRPGAYFDGEAENLIGPLLLAAEAGKPIVTVYSWLTAPADLAPARIRAARGYPLQGDSLEALCTLPDKQRDGVYGTARALMGFLGNRRTITWVTPPTDRRPGFDPHQFAGSADTHAGFESDKLQADEHHRGPSTVIADPVATSSRPRPCLHPPGRGCHDGVAK